MVVKRQNVLYLHSDCGLKKFKFESSLLILFPDEVVQDRHDGEEKAEGK